MAIQPGAMEQCGSELIVSSYLYRYMARYRVSARSLSGNSFHTYPCILSYHD